MIVQLHQILFDCCIVVTMRLSDEANMHDANFLKLTTLSPRLRQEARSFAWTGWHSGWSWTRGEEDGPPPSLDLAHDEWYKLTEELR